MRNAHCQWFTATMLAMIVAGSAILAPAAVADSRELTTVPSGPTSTSTPEPTPSPSVPSAPAEDVHNEPSSTSQALPVVGLVGGIALIGGCLIVVVMMGRERRRRDLAELQTGEGSDER